MSKYVLMDGFDELSGDQLVALVRDLSQRVLALREENDLLRAQLRGKGPGNALPPLVRPNRQERREQQGKERRKRS